MKKQAGAEAIVTFIDIKSCTDINSIRCLLQNRKKRKITLPLPFMGPSGVNSSNLGRLIVIVWYLKAQLNDLLPKMCINRYRDSKCEFESRKIICDL